MDANTRTTQPNMNSVSAGGTEGSTPASSPASANSLAMAAPKSGILVPNRVFVGGISANTSESELHQLFSAYGHVKATKIIADRGGVSKGYGFVTFETEEEAKNLQQKSDCIVLKERKLNIAPAIKKQPFNRSFDGGTGSPPAVPANTYYYTNGVGLPYQSGITFYNPAAPPGSGIAPSDPALFGATGVFGPQTTASHQPFAPMMYPVPGPSIYMPQQYPYSPMPYESYYPGAAATSSTQFMYTTNSSQNTSVNGAGSGNNSSGASTTSPSTGPQPSLSSIPPTLSYFNPATGHHPGLSGTSHPPQMDHLYYTFATGPPGPHQQLEQQFLLFNDVSNQQTGSDSLINPQEECRSTSSQSEQLQGDTQTAQPMPDNTSTTPMVPLVPVKYPLLTRYHPTNVPTIGSMHSHQNSSNIIHNNSSKQNSQTSNDTADDLNGNPLHYNTATVIYPTPIYIPSGPPPQSFHHNSPHHIHSTSLLPTPSQLQNYDLSTGKVHMINQRGYTKAASVTPNIAQCSYIKGLNSSVASTPVSAFNSNQQFSSCNSLPQYKYNSIDATQKYSSPRHVITPSITRFPSQQQYCTKRNLSSNNNGQHQYFAAQKPFQSNYRPPVPAHIPFSHSYTGHVPFNPHFHKSMNFASHFDSSSHNNFVNYINRQTNNRKIVPSVDSNCNNKNPVSSSSNISTNALTNNVTQNNKSITVTTATDTTSTPTVTSTNTPTTMTSQKSKTTSLVSLATSSPSFNPINGPPKMSNPNPQVPFYSSGGQQQQQRYQPSLSSSNLPINHPSSQHQQQRRYQMASSLRKSTEKYSSSNNNNQNHLLRQSKYKTMNGISKLGDDNLGGAGDASNVVGRLPMTPPGTPRTPLIGNQSSTTIDSGSGIEQNQLVKEACHQMKALGL